MPTAHGARSYYTDITLIDHYTAAALYSCHYVCPSKEHFDIRQDGMSAYMLCQYLMNPNRYDHLQLQDYYTPEKPTLLP